MLCYRRAVAINLLDQAVDRRLARLMRAGGGATEDELLYAADFGIVDRSEASEQAQAAKDAVDAELNALIGCDDAKTFMRDIKAKVQFVAAGGNPAVLRTCLNIVITGNPGTGKTTFSRLLFRFLHAYGVLPKDHFVERNALELKAKCVCHDLRYSCCHIRFCMHTIHRMENLWPMDGDAPSAVWWFRYVGHTTYRVKDAISEAMGGCLFLDEAYALAGGDNDRGADCFSNEAIRTLLTEVENNRTNLMVVLAGYQDKMTRLMAADPGMPRRFPQRLHLKDYTPAELAQIANLVARERFEMELAEGVEEQLAAHIAQVHLDEVSQHNGGLSVNLVEAAIGRMAARTIATNLDQQADAGSKTATNVLTAEDFEIGMHADKMQPGDKVQLEPEADGMREQEVTAHGPNGRSITAIVRSNGDFQSRQHMRVLKRDFAKRMGHCDPSQVGLQIEPVSAAAATGDASAAQQDLVTKQLDEQHAEIESLKRALAVEAERRQSEEVARQAAESKLLLLQTSACSPTASPVSSPGLTRSKSPATGDGGDSLIRMQSAPLPTARPVAESL